MDTLFHAETLILQRLLHKPTYGLAIIEDIHELTEGGIRLAFATTYQTLRNLRRRRLLDSYREKGPNPRGGRPRIMYRLTDRGRTLAMSERRSIELVLRGSPVCP